MTSTPTAPDPAPTRVPLGTAMVRRTLGIDAGDLPTAEQCPNPLLVAVGRHVMFACNQVDHFEARISHAAGKVARAADRIGEVQGAHHLHSASLLAGPLRSLAAGCLELDAWTDALARAMDAYTRAQAAPARHVATGAGPGPAPA